MAVQTTYSDRQAVAFAGMKVDTTDDVVETRINAEASAAVPFGKFVAKGGSIGDPGAVLPATSNKKLLGVVLHSNNYARTFVNANGDTVGSLSSTGLVPGTPLNVLVKGRVWIMSETAAAVGDPVFVRWDVGEANETQGSVANAADESDMIDCTGVARYITSVASASVAAPVLAVIEIDMTNFA